MTTQHPFNEEAVSWVVDDIRVHGTLTRPKGKDPFPAVIFVAGSGPTDRNWNTPLIPGTNGSGALLAHALTKKGFITLRYDKRASGPDAQENVPKMAGRISLDSHVAELSGAVNLVAGLDEVNKARIFVLTNSEGCVHALNYQNQGKQPLFAGMVLTSAFARSAGELAHDQIAAQLAAVPGGEGILSAYDAAIDEFLAGRPVHIDEKLPAGLQQMIQGITQPVNQPFSRELWEFNPARYLAKVEVPVLVVIGKKDIQVDWQTDGPLFEAVAGEHDNITITYPENASHVLKFEPESRSRLTVAKVMASYSADDVMLDSDTVDTITFWLQTHVADVF